LHSPLPSAILRGLLTDRAADADAAAIPIKEMFAEPKRAGKAKKWTAGHAAGVSGLVYLVCGYSGG
jgi:hypothetical protein